MLPGDHIVMPRRSLRSGWLGLVLLLATSPVTAQPDAAQDGGSLPPLPVLARESFPAQAGAQIGRAADEASSHPDDPERVGNLGLVLHAWEQWDAAVAAYARAAALAPTAFEWPYLRGVVLQRLAQPAAAAESFRRVAELAPSFLPARARLAESLLDAGDLGASGRAYEEISNEPGAAPVVALGRGRLAALAGRHDEAVAQFRKAIELFPQFGAAYYALAQSERALGHRAEAQAALEKHRQFGTLWPGIEDKVLARVAILKSDPRTELQRGLALANSGDLAGAIAVLEAAVAEDPSLAHERTNLIALYGRQRNWAKAEEHYRALLALGFNTDEAHYNYGVLLQAQERWSEAAAAFRAALAANPHHAAARNNLGQLLERDGRRDEAVEQYRLAIASQPSFALARFNLARMQIAMKQFDAAAANFERLAEGPSPERARYLFGLATARVLAGRVDEGVAIARQAREEAVVAQNGDLVAAIDRELAKLQR
jgi:tetratricopeptide (TPR) repeat protein